MKCKVITEAVVVGLMLAAAGTTFLKKLDFKSLFILGAAFHLLCEMLGINRWYCANGAACSA
jgi:hypothetical protein